MELLPTHQILEGGKISASFMCLLDRATMTFRSNPEVADKLKALVAEQAPNFDWSKNIFLGNEHHIPHHMEQLHTFIHPKENARGVECYIRLVEKSALIIE